MAVGAAQCGTPLCPPAPTRVLGERFSSVGGGMRCVRFYRVGAVAAQWPHAQDGAWRGLALCWMNGMCVSSSRGRNKELVHGMVSAGVEARAQRGETRLSLVGV